MRYSWIAVSSILAIAVALPIGNHNEKRVSVVIFVPLIELCLALFWANTVVQLVLNFSQTDS